MKIVAAGLILCLAACQSAEAETIVLTDQPRLTADAEALPGLAGDTAQITAINADLEALDALARENMAGCAEMAEGGPGGGWSRSITRPMTGPAYLTLREHSEWYCGGPYPASQQTAVTYDLATGRRIDWPAAIPGLGLTLGGTEEMPAGYVALVSSPALGAWYSRTMLAVPDAEWVDQCRNAFDPEQLAEQSFNIWVDAENGGVTVAPDFPHVIQACAESATITTADLAGFDAAPALVDAITTAHAAGNWSPKE